MTNKATDRSEEVYELRLALETKEREVAKLQAELEKVTSKASEETSKLRKLTRKMTAEILEATRTVPLLDNRAVPELVEDAIEQGGDWNEGTDGRLYTKTGSVSNWLQAYKSERPFFFADYTGAQRQHQVPVGISGSGQAGGEISAELREIFHPKTMNLTRACEIEKKDPELAARVAELVGNTIFMNQQPTRRSGA